MSLLATPTPTYSLRRCAFGAHRPRLAAAPRAARLPVAAEATWGRGVWGGEARQDGQLVESLQAGAWQAGLSVLASMLLLCSPAQAGDAGNIILGPARVVDGDTLEVAGTRIRLYGVDAPEKAQSCQKGGRDYACGQDSKEALAAKVGQAPVACEVKNKDLYGRTVAACFAAAGKGGDLGAYMVENGYAVAYRQYSKEYIPLEEQARAAKRGIWAGSFQEPSQWRKDNPRAGSAADPARALVAAALPPGASTPTKSPPNPSCPIKGNINAKGEKIYHVPGGRSYDATDIVLAEGERWFCSETEAQSAGWRAAKN